MAKIEPVTVGGVVVSNATLHNEDEINRKDVRVGDTIIVQRAGDVIPQVVSVDFDKREKKLQKNIFFLINVCVEVKFKKNLIYQLKKKTLLGRCTKGYDCSFIAKERLKHIVSKEAFNIDGLGKKVIDQFWKLNLIKNPSDIFELDFDKIKKLEGWGELSVKNLKKP